MLILSEDINKTQSKNLHTESFYLLSIEMYTYNYMIIYMPNVEWHIVITQWMIGIIGYYRIGYIIGHVVDPEIYQFSSMRSFLQYAVQSPV